MNIINLRSKKLKDTTEFSTDEYKDEDEDIF